MRNTDLCVFFGNTALTARLWRRDSIGGGVVTRMPNHRVCLIAGALGHGGPTPRHVHRLGLLGCLVLVGPCTGLAGIRLLLLTAAAERLVNAGAPVTGPTAAPSFLPLGPANVQYVLGHIGTQLLSGNTDQWFSLSMRTLDALLSGLVTTHACGSL